MAWLDASGAIKATFVYGLHANVPAYMVKGTTTYRIITDQMGSVRLVENSSTGAVPERIDYDEFGNVLKDTAPGIQPFGFAGGLRDADTGLTRLGARDVDPVTGRWTAKDREGLEGGLNVYEYAASDPENHIDPSGLDWVFSQSTGQMYHFNGSTGDGFGLKDLPGSDATPVATGYSGFGWGLNNPALQSWPDTGPIPQGVYSIGPQQDNGPLKASMRLTPDPHNQMYDRDRFLIHGPHQNDHRDSSAGCPVIDRPSRDQIANSGDHVLRVIP